jgi:hypothetical protein
MPDAKFRTRHSPNVGVGLPAMAVVQVMMYWLIQRIREQARFHLYAAVFA